MPQKLAILILEDNERLLDSLTRFILKAMKNQIDVLTATNVAEAEGLLESRSASICVLVTDVMMPDKTPAGLDLAIKYAPRLPIIVISTFDATSYERAPELLGAVQFLAKLPQKKFQAELIANIKSHILMRQFSDRVKEESEEFQSLCLRRRKGAILATRFRLPNLNADDIPAIDLRNMDFATIAFGTRQWQASIEESAGRIHAMHDQSLWASFQDTSSQQEGLQSAIESFLRVSEELDGEWKAGFDQCPFGTAAVPGQIVAGLFGNGLPGIEAIVNRLGDIAFQLASQAGPREIAVVRSWMTAVRRRWFDLLPGTRRIDMVHLTNLNTPVEVTFYRR